MAKIIECVPNFSEGVDQNTIDGIAKAIAATDGKYLIVRFDLGLTYKLSRKGKTIDKSGLSMAFLITTAAQLFILLAEKILVHAEDLRT